MFLFLYYYAIDIPIFILRCMIRGIDQRNGVINHHLCNLAQVQKSKLRVGQCTMLMVTSFIQLNGEAGRKLTTLRSVLGEILEMEKVTDME